MNKIKTGIFMLIFLCSFLLPANGFCLESLQNRWQLNDIASAKGYFLKKIGGDPYIIFPQLPDPVCVISGVRLTLSFSPAIVKPFLAELFWKSENGSFNEAHKVFFFLHPPKEGDTLDIVVPIRYDIGYNQIRLDLPRDLDADFAVQTFETVSLDDPEFYLKQIESFFALRPEEAKEADIVIPYVMGTLIHGAQRFTEDRYFMAFWFSILLATLFGIRRITRETAKYNAE